MNTNTFSLLWLLFFPMIGSSQTSGKFDPTGIDSIFIYQQVKPGGTTAMVRSSLLALANSDERPVKLAENEVAIFKKALKKKPKKLLQQKYGPVYYGLVYLNGAKRYCIFSSNDTRVQVHDLTQMTRWSVEKAEMKSIHQLLQRYY